MNQLANVIVLLFISLLNIVFSQLQYSNATCTGDICALYSSSSQVECVSQSGVTFSETFFLSNPDTANNGANDSFIFRGVAISPFDGTIYVAYQDTSITLNPIYIGTIPNPSTITASSQALVTRLGNAVADNTLKSLTFDCNNNLFAISEDGSPDIFQIDLSDGSDTFINTITNNFPTEVNMCSQGGFPGICQESLFYNWEAMQFHRISSINQGSTVLFNRTTINATDFPSEGTDVIFNSICGAEEIITATYIGNSLVLIYCRADTVFQILDITDITMPTVSAIAPMNDISSSGVNGVFNYVSGSVSALCKPLSCSSNPSMSPTEFPTTTPTNYPTIPPREYEEAVCNGQILALHGSDAYGIKNIPDSITFDALVNYQMSNPPSDAIDEFAFTFLSAAVEPVTGDIYVIIRVRNQQFDSDSYLGIIDTVNQEVQLIYDAIGTKLPDYSSMTFDCERNLFAVEKENRDIYPINVVNNMTVVSDKIETPDFQCIQGETCYESISFHWESQQIYRITSLNAHSKSVHKLFIRNADGTEIGYNITDPNDLCLHTQDGIVEMEYIGNDLFLIACDNEVIRMLDTSNINGGGNPEIIEIGDNEIINTPQTFIGLIPFDSNNTVCIPPSCTQSPTTQSPTTHNPTTQSPTTSNPTIANECEDRCDAFSVIVDEYDLLTDDDEEIICINYTVTRLSDEYPLCDRAIKNFILGLCDSDGALSCDSDDLNGLIQSFEIISSDSSVTDSHYFVWGSRRGITINIRVQNELKFELCLTNVFEDSIQFSDNVGFRRGTDKFVCDGNMALFNGLPCIDENNFEKDSYDSSGYNQHRPDGGNRRKNRGSDSGESAMIREQLTNEHKLGILSELDPYILWTLISIFAVFGFLMIIAAIICLRRKKNNKQTQLADNTFVETVKL